MSQPIILPAVVKYEAREPKETTRGPRINVKVTFEDGAEAQIWGDPNSPIADWKRGQINPNKIACFWLAENCTAGKNNDLMLGLAIAIGYTKNPRTAKLPRGMGCQPYFINH